MKKYSLVIVFRMMAKLAASVLLVFVTVHSVSHAQCASGRNCGYEQSIGQRFCAVSNVNQQWPKIYIPKARNSVYSAYDAMISNGWRRQNLLGTYHFKDQSNELTQAGKLKVDWILTQAPVQHRNVFVQRGVTELNTTARIASVQEYATNLDSRLGPVHVNDTHIVAEGHRASSVDRVFVGYVENRLPPVLPASTGGSNGL